jgi:hypothetical protein
VFCLDLLCDVPRPTYYVGLTARLWRHCEGLWYASCEGTNDEFIGRLVISAVWREEPYDSSPTGTVAAGAAAQATDMTGDLKTGFLLRAKVSIFLDSPPHFIE